MLKKIANLFDIEDSIFRLVQIGSNIAMGICLLGILSLLIFLKHYISYDLYEGGIILFKTGILLAMQSLICGIAINYIKNS